VGYDATCQRHDAAVLDITINCHILDIVAIWLNYFNKAVLKIQITHTHKQTNDTNTFHDFLDRDRIKSKIVLFVLSDPQIKLLTKHYPVRRWWPWPMRKSMDFFVSSKGNKQHNYLEGNIKVMSNTCNVISYKPLKFLWLHVPWSLTSDPANQ
jgi:hypothetical protein